MLQHTFQHLRGFSEHRERQLWQKHVYTLSALARLTPQQERLFTDVVDDPTRGQGEIEASLAALTKGDADFFAQRLPKREHFRIALAFPNDTIFLDIETTGLSRVYNHITVVGWFLNGSYGFFVRGQSAAALKEALKRAKVIVTFNGSLFDLPFINHELPQLRVPSVHVDVRFLARRIGLSGGQKLIEEQLDVVRDSAVSNVTGEFAPVLWADYKRGDIEPLRRLLQYNAADIRGMRLIFDHIARVVAANAGLPRKCIASFPRFAPTNLSQDLAIVSTSSDKHLRPWRIPKVPALTLEELLAECNKRPLVSIGIDLTGSETKASGWCVLREDTALTELIFSDDELVRRSLACRPSVISIDSPLTLPEGRRSVFDDDPGRSEFGIMRYCERELKRRGVNVYPALIPSMQRLTARGIRLASRFRSLGVPVIESYPGAAQDIMGIVRKRKGLDHLTNGLKEFGVQGLDTTRKISHDELDAITSALVGGFFWSGRTERLGKDPIGEEALFIPQLKKACANELGRRVIGLSGALGAGKTTAARFFEKRGFKYCRYSEVIESLARAKDLDVTRQVLQEEGQRVHSELGQRWLGRALLRAHLVSEKLVIDGLRFPDDHAFLVELFGWRFSHVHVRVARNIRKARYEARELADFEVAASHEVESKAETLENLANIVLENNGTLSSYEVSLNKVLDALT
jgi:uncharacterized protein YprB with RNaseH-like and TPR domain/predicted nuclease with RNAse H fold/dephospho-CoA kinase